MKIVLTGGGTGGHIFPLVAVAKKLREILGNNCDMLFIGTGDDMEKNAMTLEGIPVKKVLCGKKRRYFSIKNYIDPLKIPIGIVQSLWILLWYMPDVVFSKGGYASVPLVMAAWLYRIPVMIHESDAAAGSANKFLSKIAKRIAYSYPSAANFFPQEKVAMTGNPIRPEILEGNAEYFFKEMNLASSKPVIIILGGSQGARVINRSIVKILPKLMQRALVIHQTGKNNFEETVHLAAEYGIKSGRDGYIPVDFLDIEKLKNALSAAKLIISRAGANTIAEIAAVGKPAILIPLENSANDHQKMNAYSLARIGGALVLEENNLGEHILFESIVKLLDDDELLKSMSEKIRFFYHPEAAEKIAQGIIELADNLQ